MTNPRSLRQRAQAGEPLAIAALMNQSFQSQGIRATAIANGSELNIYLEAETVPNPRLSQRIKQGLAALGVTQYTRVVVHGRQAGNNRPDWSQAIMLTGEASSSATSELPPTQAVTSSPTSQRPSPARATVPQRRPPAIPAVPPRSPLQSLKMMAALLGKWVFFSFIVCMIPTFILMAVFGLIPLAIYLGLLGFLWGRIQAWVLKPYWGDRAERWQAPTLWGFMACGGVVLAVRFAMYAVWRRVPVTDRVDVWIMVLILLGVTALGYLSGKVQASCFEPDLREHGPTLPPGCRWWSLANAGIGLCMGASLALTYLIFRNPHWLRGLHGAIGSLVGHGQPLGLITLFPTVLIYLIGTGLVLAYCLEIEQRQRLATTTTDVAGASLAAIPGLETFGRVPLALPFFGMAVIPVALLTPILPPLGFLTLMVFWIFAYQLGRWLKIWAFVVGAVATLVALLPYVGFALFAPGMRTFAGVALMVVLGMTVVSFVLGAIAWLPSKSWRNAGGIALLGPSLSFALTGLIVLAAL